MKRAPQSFFLYMHQRGVSVDTYVAQMEGFMLYRIEGYEQLWPVEWASYKTMCRLLDYEPH